MITFKHTGNFNKTDKFLKSASNLNYLSIFDKYAKAGVAALSAATPINSGETANSWGYQIKEIKNGIKIIWTNSHIVDGVPIAVILQYGHGTRNGGYVQGRDYINPAIQPIFDKIVNEAWGEVKAL